MPKRTNAAVTGDFSTKEILFIHHFCSNGGHGQNAAIAAGYAPKNAKTQACRMLATPRVKAEVDRVMGKALAKSEVTIDRVISELANIAFSDVGEAFATNGDLKPIHEMPETIRRALSGIDVDQLFEGRGEDREHIGYTKKIRMWEKTKALELLGRHLKMFTDKIEFSDRPMVYVKDMTGRKNKAEAAD